MEAKLSVVAIEKPDPINLILGQTHFIKAVEDIHEALAWVWWMECRPRVWKARRMLNGAGNFPGRSAISFERSCAIRNRINGLRG